MKFINFFYTSTVFTLFLNLSCFLFISHAMAAPLTDNNGKIETHSADKAFGESSSNVKNQIVIPTALPITDSAPLVQSGPLTFHPLVKKVVPAVVNIAVNQTLSTDQQNNMKIPPSLKGTPFEKEFRKKQLELNQKITDAGSGFIIDPSGIIVTNTHVVGQSDDIVVSLTDGRQLPATIIGSDSLTDIAVIKVQSDQPLPYVLWGDSRKVEVGDWIVAAGNPFGLGSSVTAGIVSARGRDIGSGPFDDFLQLDAPMNPGNSGGPSFNLAGQVVALNTAIVSPTGSSVGIGFGIPSEIVAPIVRQLCKTGYIDRGWLGVTLDDSGKSPGVKIIEIDKNGPAFKAKIRAGDRVEKIDDQPIDTARTFIKTVAIAHPGTKLNLKIKRNGRYITIDVLVGHRPKNLDN
ncbi:Periplasmic pH-dependent serine endoprotease DegQ [Commensalibacter sp. Nvir]|uniref:S1C family serine protease n=1 Tax=Commensalibacter sp. Nvir TaxID=3069817 RepID=UPI002D61AFA9|nr:Periplasmic pH-dependent serine endoprotease DegQ [Commensalibacter sp. Nvir]